MTKLRVGILGATGMVGQRLITLLANHPWFEVTCVAASEKSADKPYAEAVQGRWSQEGAIPEAIAALTVHSVERDAKLIAESVSLVFSAIEADKDYVKHTEELYAGLGLAVLSNASAHRWTEDVPMIMPEINPEHLKMIDVQRTNRGWTTGCIVVKPNCSIQCYVPLLKAWEAFGPEEVIVSTYQAISGAGKTFATWPEMNDTVIPYIKGEEEKSEREPMKVLANVEDEKFVLAQSPKISATCIRVPVSDGHLASINIRFKGTPSREELIDALRNFDNPLAELGLPSAPTPFITYHEEDDRPQTRLDRDLEGGMGISVGRLREDALGWKCVSLAHNTIRGAAGGNILCAELLVRKGYIPSDFSL